jgi:hypothetical protein
MQRKDLIVSGVFFRVDGADIDSGQEKVLVLEADSGEQAEEMARDRGLVIASVRPATEEDRTSPKPLPPSVGGAEKSSVTGQIEMGPPPVTWPAGVDGKSIFSDGPATALTFAPPRTPSIPASAPIASKPSESTAPPARPAPARIGPPRVDRAGVGTPAPKPIAHRLPPTPRSPASGHNKPPATVGFREAGGLSSGSSLLAERMRKKVAPAAPAQAPVGKMEDAKKSEPAIEEKLKTPDVISSPAVGDRETAASETAKPAPADRARPGDTAVVSRVDLGSSSPALTAFEEPAAWSHASALVAGAVTATKEAKVQSPSLAPPLVPQPAAGSVVGPAAPTLAAIPVAVPAAATTPIAHSTGGWLATLLLSPLAFLSLAGGIALLVYSLSRPDPSDPTDLEKLDLHVQLLTHCLLGGVLVLGGLLLFVAAGVVYLGGKLNRNS